MFLPMISCFINWLIRSPAGLISVKIKSSPSSVGRYMATPLFMVLNNSRKRTSLIRTISADQACPVINDQRHCDDRDHPQGNDHTDKFVCQNPLGRRQKDDRPSFKINGFLKTRWFFPLKEISIPSVTSFGRIASKFFSPNCLDFSNASRVSRLIGQRLLKFISLLPDRKTIPFGSSRKKYG